MMSHFNPINMRIMTIKSNILLLISSLLFAGFVNTAMAQKSIELKYKLLPGDQFSNKSNIEQTIQFEAMGQKATLDQDMVFYMTSFIDSVKDGMITQRTVFDHIVMDQQIFGMQIKYDSQDTSTFDSPMGAEFATQMNKMIGAAVISVMNERGQVDRMDVLALGDAGDMSGNLNSGNNYAVYPDHKVKVGDNWTEQITPQESSNITVNMIYTLTRSTRQQAMLTLNGTLSENLTNPEANGKVDGTMKGEMTIDRKTGMVSLSKIQMDMTMQMEKDGMTFPATVTSFIDTEIKKIK